MRIFIQLSLLAMFSLPVFSQPEGYMQANALDRRGLSNIIEAPEGKHGKRCTALTSTVTVQALATKRNKSCVTQITVTVTPQAAAGPRESGNIPPSFLTTTVSATGVFSTVIVTPLPDLTTQTSTVTVNGVAASTVSPYSGSVESEAKSPTPAGINPPSSDIGSAENGKTGPTSTPPIAIATPALAASAIGSPGSLTNGTGTLSPDGFCACSCLCGEGSFPESPTATTSSSPTTVVPTTLQTISSSIIETSSTTDSSPLIAASSSVSAPPDSSLQPSITPTSSSVIPPPAASLLTFSLTVAISSLTIATETPEVAGEPTSINISTFSLSSNLNLGSLALATIKV